MYIWQKFETFGQLFLDAVLQEDARQKFIFSSLDISMFPKPSLPSKESYQHLLPLISSSS
jgi:hypothetical protein